MNCKSSMVAVVLAAGSSSRLGQPKQLVEIRGIPLLQRVISAFRNIDSIRRIIVVTGANENSVRKRLENLDTFSGIEWIGNPDWNLGMGRSLACAIEHIENQYMDIQHAMVSVCDQPFLDSDIVRRLVHRSNRHPENIIPSAYSGTVGPPVIFPRRYFQELLDIGANSGAKSVIMRNMDNALPVAFPKGNVDIDTVADLEGI